MVEKLLQIVMDIYLANRNLYWEIVLKKLDYKEYIYIFQDTITISLVTSTNRTKISLTENIIWRLQFCFNYKNT